MTITNCKNCGGTHHGSHECPYIKKPCVVCGADTVLACSDCAMDFGSKDAVHVCEKVECRDAHEKERHPPKPQVAPDPIELVARALHAADEHPDYLWPQLWGPAKEHYLKLARAAITTLETLRAKQAQQT